MREIKFRVWHIQEKKMYFLGYQKLSHILLCDDDHGSNEGKGVPVKRAAYSDCEMLESTGIIDISGKEIFEGDIVRVRLAGKFFEGVVGPVPDMFRSRKLHPLHDLIAQHDISDDEENMKIEIIGNRFEKLK